MPEFRDQVGVAYTATNATSIDKFHEIMISYLESRQNVMALLDDLLKDEPEMPMARCFRGYLLKLASDPRFTLPAKNELRQLQALETIMNPREKLHLAALDAWLSNQPTAATAIMEQLLAEYPRDMLALKLAQHLHFYAGDSIAMRDSVARAAKHWQGDEPYFSFLLGMYSFGLEEAGDYDDAETKGRQAVELNTNDQWATHAVAHVMWMQGRYNEGIDWTGNLLPRWQQSNNFINHVHWHKALFHLGEDDPTTALQIYDDYLLTPLADDFYLDVCNATSLLWRLELAGIDMEDRWQQLETYASRARDDELIFCSLHYLMVPARLGKKDEAEQALQHIRQWATADTSQGQVVKEVGLSLAEAIVDIGNANYDAAASTLNDIEDDIIAIGGSHAQRSIFQELQRYATQQSQ